jgi:hypothetical protein
MVGRDYDLVQCLAHAVSRTPIPIHWEYGRIERSISIDVHDAPKSTFLIIYHILDAARPRVDRHRVFPGGKECGRVGSV